MSIKGKINKTRVNKKINNAVNKKMLAIGLEIKREVREASPVVTGLFKASWVLTPLTRAFKLSNKAPYASYVFVAHPNLENILTSSTKFKRR